MKRAFDYIFQSILILKIVDFSINDDLISWMQLFLAERLVELVIDGFTNLRQKVESEIPQESPVSPILFLIYISEVFSIIKKHLLYVTCVSFIINLSFLIADLSISKLVKTLEKMGEIVLKREKNNAITYDTSKTKVVLFSKAC